MSEFLNTIYETVASGWIVTWPTRLLALIWLAWVVSWVAASFWSGRTKSHVRTRNSWIYRLPILLGAILLSPWPAARLGDKPLYDPGNAGTYMLAVVVLLGISFTWWARIHLGRFWSNAITHKEDHTIVEFRTLRAGASSHLYGLDPCNTRDGRRRCNRGIAARCASDLIRRMAEGAHGRAIPQRGTRPRGLSIV